MFTTDSFINAEISYREERLRKDWGTFDRRGGARRAARATR